MKVVANKNIMFHQKLEITSKRTTREKLMSYLMLQAKQYKSNRFEIPYDRQELADYLQVERSGLSAEIGKLRRKEFLSVGKMCFRCFGVMHSHGRIFSKTIKKSFVPLL